MDQAMLSSINHTAAAYQTTAARICPNSCIQRHSWQYHSQSCCIYARCLMHSLIRSRHTGINSTPNGQRHSACSCDSILWHAFLHSQSALHPAFGHAAIHKTAGKLHNKCFMRHGDLQIRCKSAWSGTISRAVVHGAFNFSCSDSQCTAQWLHRMGADLVISLCRH